MTKATRVDEETRQMVSLIRKDEMYPASFRNRTARFKEGRYKYGKVSHRPAIVVKAAKREAAAD